MSGFLGMDVEAIRALAGQLAAKADALDEMAMSISKLLEVTQWVGNDATSFRSDWSSSHRAALLSVASALRDASTMSTNNANQQEQFSAH